ncbi:MAG: hypothetical protein LBT49_03675 [Prevotellaceae bacterium]|jgi:hypothetical protein|nr:hypothetical protein [Prevotellaceae bacterium]
MDNEQWAVNGEGLTVNGKMQPLAVIRFPLIVIRVLFISNWFVRRKGKKEFG